MLRRITTSQRGSAAVEFALVLPVLIVLLFGIIEFGIILYNKAVITNASREGARYGIVFRTPGEEVTCDMIYDVIYGRLGCDGSGANCANLITFGAASSIGTPTIDPPDDCNPSSGNNLTVTVSYDYDYLLLPNFVTALTGTLTLTGETVMVKE